MILIILGGGLFGNHLLQGEDRAHPVIVADGVDMTTITVQILVEVESKLCHCSEHKFEAPKHTKGNRATRPGYDSPND